MKAKTKQGEVQKTRKSKKYIIFKETQRKLMLISITEILIYVHFFLINKYYKCM